MSPTSRRHARRLSMLGFAVCFVAPLLAVAPTMARAASVGQPQPFTHQHHVSELGLDCRSCHVTVDISANAGMPGDATCTSCHARLTADAAAHGAGAEGLASRAAGRSARLPEFVNFDHSLHSARGVACVACHGDVERTPLAAQANPTTTGWCADCHRHRERIASRIGRLDALPRADALAFAPAASAARATRTDAPGASCNVPEDRPADRCNILFYGVIDSGM